MTDLLTVGGAVLAVAVVAMTLTALLARRVGRVSVVDVTWGLALSAAAVACALVGPAVGGPDAWRCWLVAVLVTVWGLRLSAHIHRRSRGQGEDPRYAEMLGDGGFGTAVRKVFAVQGAAVWLVSLPVMAAAVTSTRWVWLVWLGVVVWLVGLVFEAVGDAQLARYRARPRDERPPVLDTGLWRYTRHPNYFGDACVWWGIWLAGGAASGWVAGVVTLVAPVAMTYFLAFATGARLLERSMMRRPGYAAYAARTSMFVPLPPRG